LAGSIDLEAGPKVAATGSGALAALKTHLRASTDFVAGLFFVALAGLGLWLLRDVRLGTTMRMGPGFLPTITCYFLLLLGLIMVGRSFFFAGEPLEGWYARPLAVVLGSILVFALGIGRFGLFATTVVVVGVAAFATPESRWKEVILAMIALAAFSTALFIWALGLPMPAWPQLPVL
jgi:putative tricarboxylic transport membrane protein